jgi:hypothetical protein
MSHSFIFLDREFEERTFGCSDGTIEVYLSFFIMIMYKDSNPLNENLNKLYIVYYKEQLTGFYYSQMNIHIDEIYEDKVKQAWYLEKLIELEKFFISFGDLVNHNYLNNLKVFPLEFTRPIKTERFLNFITNVRWVLRVDDVIPNTIEFSVFHSVFNKKTGKLEKGIYDKYYLEE